MTAVDSEQYSEEMSSQGKIDQGNDSQSQFLWSLDSKILAAKNVLMQDLSGESVLLNLQTEQYFGLDDVGTRMWQVLTEQSSIQAAIEVLLDDYDVESNQLEQDVKQLIGKLFEENLIEVADS